MQSKSLCRLCPWVFPGKNTSVGCHILLQGIFQTQRWNPGLLHCRQILYLRRGCPLPTPDTHAIGQGILLSTFGSSLQTPKSLLQHHSSNASILRRSAFFTVQLSHPYMTTGKTIALTRQTFVGKVMSLLVNMLSRLVITFLPRSKRLLISWLQSPYAVILEPPKDKV